MGLEDGMRGEIDTNKKFSDGAREDDPEKKSAAGQFLSDHSGIRGGAKVGEKVGKWGGGAVSALVMLKILTAAVISGIWPFIAVGLLVVAAGVVGGMLSGVVGKYAGAVVGAVVGGAAGMVVGAYNGAFRRGKYVAKEPAPDSPEAAGPMPASPQPNQSTAPATAVAAPQQPTEPMTIPQNDPRVQHVMDTFPPPEKEEDRVLAANPRVRNSWFLGIGHKCMEAGKTVLGYCGLGPRAHPAGQNVAPPPVMPPATIPPRYERHYVTEAAAERAPDYWQRQIRPAAAPSVKTESLVDQLKAEQRQGMALSK